MRLAYIKALFLQPISVLDVLPPGQTAAIITVTANILQAGISERLSMLLQNVSLVVTALIIAVRFSWLLTLVASSGLIFIALVYWYTIPHFVKSMKEVGYADRMSSGVASEAFGAIRMVHACGAESKMAKRYADWVEESHRRGLKMSPVVALQQAPSKLQIFNAMLRQADLLFKSSLRFKRKVPSAVRNVLAYAFSICALAFWVAVKLYEGAYFTDVKTIIM